MAYTQNPENRAAELRRELPHNSMAERDPVNATESLALTEKVKSSIRVLIVDDEHTLRESCASVLSVEGFDVSVCARGSEALTLLKRRPFDIVLLDLHMSQVPGMELLAACLETHPDTVAIIMTGNPNVQSSIEALRAGAWDYLPKPFTATHLQILFGRARHALATLQTETTAEQKVKNEFGHSTDLTLLGRSPMFLNALRLAEKVARTDASVFLTG